MKVVVLLSSYNGEKFISEQLNSIISQKGNFEIKIIVRDDGSKDSTQEILKKYASEDKIAWYTGENLGPAQSFFNLLKNCGEYDYYAFSDQDDIWDSNKIESAISVLESVNTPACYYCNARIVYDNDKTFEKTVYNNVKHEVSKKDNLLMEICAGAAMGCTMVINNQLAKRLHEYGFPQKVIMHDSFIQATCKAIGGTVFFDGKPHMSYRQHTNNVIGCRKGIIDAIKFRLDYLFKEREVKVSDQANAILELYYTLLNKDSIKVLDEVANYNNNIYNRVKLALSSQFNFNSLKNSIFVRVTILAGKR